MISIILRHKIRKLVVFLLLDLSDMLSDDDEKENLSPDDMPSTVVIDTFGELFEEAVRAILSSYLKLLRYL